MTTTPGIERYLERPLTPPVHEARVALDGPAIDPGLALPLAGVDRLLDPEPVAAEYGWCWLPGGIGYVAARTPMPEVTGEMVDWWFGWHAHDPLRYRAWHPTAHFSSRVDRRRDSVHHVVEDVGSGVEHVRIEFIAPEAFGYGAGALAGGDVAAIVAARVGADRLRVTHTRMTHVWLREGEGTMMRSRFWFGSELWWPLRRVALPRTLPRVVLRHCVEEYANLAGLLPELWCEYGPGSGD